jgi:hypothetical protein
MRIDSSGNVGIGTSSPSARLQAYAGTGVSAAHAIIGASATGDWDFSNGGNPTSRVLLRGYDSSAVEQIRLDPVAASFFLGGNVGIGTSSPAVSGLEISRATGTASPTPAELRLSTTNDGSDWSTTDPWGRLSFYSADTSSAGPKIVSAIDVTAAAASGGTGNLSFKLAAITTGTLTERMRIDSSGALILVGSTAQKATGTTWSNPSDQRLKDNIRDYTKGTAELMQVRVREWEYNGKGGTIEGTKGLGVVADEVMVVLPDTVENYKAKLNIDDEEVTPIKKFDATEITWLLVKAVQEQQAVIANLTTRIETLESK